jgi:Uma2 family endonuclease
MVTTILRKTIDDLHAMPNDGRRYELIDGEIVVSASPSEPHFWVVRRLFLLLLPFDDIHKRGWLYFAPLEVHLPAGDVVQPDLFFFSRDDPPVRHGTHLEGVPLIAFEISSPSTQSVDRGRKRRAYERAGLPEYWIPDPERREIVALVHRADGYERLSLIDGKIHSEVLPGFVDVETLFADLP